MKLPEPKPAGTWDFYGACAPDERPDGSYGPAASETSFTLGLFQWVARSDGAGTKHGKVSGRIRGSVDLPARAFNAARSICQSRNAGIGL